MKNVAQNIHTCKTKIVLMKFYKCGFFIVYTVKQCIKPYLNTTFSVVQQVNFTGHFLINTLWGLSSTFEFK